MPVILLRHTRPAVAEGTCYGRSDLALAQDFGAALAGILRDLPEVARVVTSPLTRCRRLAEAIAAERGLGLVADDRLREMDFGSWEGRAWAAIPRADLDAWAADFHGARPHGGESVAMLAARVGAALTETPASRPPVLWVAHSGIARAAAALTGRDPGWETDLAFGAWLDLSDGPARTSPLPDRRRTPTR
jgi:alpha-ribazole phosphatase